MKCTYCQQESTNDAFCSVCAAPFSEAAPAEAFATFNAAALAAEKLPPMTPVVPGMIPRGMSIIAGRPKDGKSCLAMELSLAVATGGDWNGAQCEQGRVLYVAMEDTKQTLQGRLKKMGTDAPANLSMTLDCPDFAALEAWIVANKPILVVLDTLQKWRRGKASTYHRDYAEGGKFKSLADRHGIALIVIHHTTKLRQASPLDSVSGSSGVTAAADAVIVLVRDNDRAALWITGRSLPSTVLPLRFGADCRWTLASRGIEERKPWLVGTSGGTIVYCGEADANDAMQKRCANVNKTPAMTETELKLTFNGAKCAKLVRN